MSIFSSFIRTFLRNRNPPLPSLWAHLVRSFLLLVLISAPLAAQETSLPALGNEPLPVVPEDLSSKPIVEGIAALVGDNIILKSDVAQLVNMTALQQGIYPQEQPEKFQQLQAGLLQSMIDQKIVLEMAELDSIEVKDSDVDNALDMQLDNIIAQAGTEERAEEMLGQSLKSFRREFWFDMRDRLISEQYQQQLLSSVSVTRDDIITFFSTYKDSIPSFPTTVKLRHLLIKINPSQKTRDNTYRLLDSLRTEILAGADFGNIAEQYSMDPGSRKNGGSLGFVRRGSLVQEFETVAFTLPPGEISKPIETVFGYHLIQTLENQGEKIHVRHILITPKISEEDESLSFRFASSLKDSATTLDAFLELVETHSADDKTASIGGDLGWINPSTYPVPEIGQVITYLTLNECSPPVKTEFGYHLLWMEAVRPGGKASLDLHWPDIEAMALNQKKMQWYQHWIEEARKNIFISITD